MNALLTSPGEPGTDDRFAGVAAHFSDIDPATLPALLRDYRKLALDTVRNPEQFRNADSVRQYANVAIRALSDRAHRLGVDLAVAP